MALHGSASPNLAPILFKGNNRSFAVNLLIHQDESGSMDPFIQFYSTGSFIGNLQDSLLAEGIGIDITRYPNLYGYFGYNSRNPTTSFNISNREGVLNVSQAFMKGEATGTATITNWTSSYFNNVATNHVVNVCTNLVGQTGAVGRLATQPADDFTEDVHGNLWSIFTSPNAISTGTGGRFGSIINSTIRKNTTTVIITNSNEQSGAPAPMIGPATGQTRTFVPVVVGNYAFNVTSTTFLENGRTNMTQTFSGSSDNNNYSITSPFPINFLGPTNSGGDVYTSVFFGTNGYFTFGGGSNDSTGLASPTVPNRPAIKVFAGDKTLNWLGHRTIGTTPNRTWIVRYEGVNPIILLPLSVSSVSFVENGRTGLTASVISVSGVDGGNFLITSPFSINFLGTNYTQMNINANGYVTLSSTAGTTAFGGLSNPTTPALPAIKIFAQDLLVNWAGSGTIGTAPNRKFIVRFEGQPDDGAGRTGSQIAEVVFYEGQNYYDVYYAANYSTGTVGVQDGTSASYLATWVPTTNTVSPYTTGQGFRITQSFTDAGSEIYEARFYENMGDVDYIDLHYVANSNTGTAGLQNGTSGSYLSTWTPAQNTNSPYTTGEAFRINVANSRTINGLIGEMLFRDYRIVALSSYNSTDGYDGVLFYGNSFVEPYGYVIFTGPTTFTITRSTTAPNWTPSTTLGSQQYHNTLLLASQTRGALFKIGRVYDAGANIDNRTAFSNCLAKYLASTI